MDMPSGQVKSIGLLKVLMGFCGMNGCTAGCPHWPFGDGGTRPPLPLGPGPGGIGGNTPLPFGFGPGPGGIIPLPFG